MRQNAHTSQMAIYPDTKKHTVVAQSIAEPLNVNQIQKETRKHGSHGVYTTKIQQMITREEIITAWKYASVAVTQMLGSAREAFWFPEFSKREEYVRIPKFQRAGI